MFKRLCGMIGVWGILLSLAAPAGAATYMVSNESDTVAQPPGSLRSMVGIAANGDTITFNSTVNSITLNPAAGTISFTQTGLSFIADHLVTISGNDAFQLFNAATSLAAIEGLILERGNNLTNYGGALYLGAGGISGGIKNSAFNNNTARGGGAVFVSGALDGGIDQSKFTDNTAGLGGAMFVNGIFNGGINRSTFSDNQAADGTTTPGTGGGAVFVNDVFNGGIYDSEFKNNTAANDGGAVAVNHSFNGDISGSRFKNNTAANSGGAVLVWGDLNGGISTSTFSNNGSGNSGGAVHMHGGLTGGIKNSKFTGNTANASGGAVFVDGGLNGGFSGSIFRDNKSGAAGGAVYVNGKLSGDISNAAFDKNSAVWGGAVYAGGAADLSGSNALFRGNSAALGGAIYHQAVLDPAAPDKNFRLSATAGEPIIFEGNTHNPGNKGVTPNSIYFGNDYPAGENRRTSATFDVAEGGLLLMWDPLASQPDDLDVGGGALSNLALDINKTGPGVWVLAGVSDMQSATHWTVSQGALHLAADKNSAPAHISLANTTNKMNVSDPAAFTLKNGASLIVEPTTAAHRISGQKIALESGSLVGVAGHMYGPMLSQGQHIVLTLDAPDISNQSGIPNPDGAITIGVNAYKYTGLAWDGRNLVMNVGPAQQTPTLSGVPAVTGSSHAAFRSLNTTLTALGGRVAGVFRDLQTRPGAGIAPAQDVEDVEEVSAADGVVHLTSAPGAGEPATRYRAADQPGRVWFTPYYAYTDQSGSGTVGYDLHTPGLALGFERLLGERAFAGLAFTVNWPDYNGEGTQIDAANLTLALYGGGILPWGEIELDARIGYGWTDYDQTRRVETVRMDSDYDGEMFFAGAGLARTFWLNDSGLGFWLRPNASYDYIHLSTDGFDEGAGIFAISVDDYDQDLHRVKAGLEAGYEFESGLTASAEAYYLGVYGDREAETSGHFVNDAANPWSLVGNGLDENSLGLSAKVGLPLGPNWDLGVGYDFLVGEDAATHQGSATITFRF